MPYKETRYTIGNQRSEKKEIYAAKRSKTITINNNPSNLIRCLNKKLLTICVLLQQQN